MKVTTSTEAKVTFFQRNERKKNDFESMENITKRSTCTGLGFKLEYLKTKWYKTTVNGYWCHRRHIYKATINYV